MKTPEETREKMRHDNPEGLKTHFGGYRRQEVDDYIASLQSTMQASVASYEEKLDELKNNLKMVTRELEDTKSSCAEIEAERNALREKLSFVEDQAQNIDALTQERDRLQKQLQENENYAVVAADLRARNEGLEQELSRRDETVQQQEEHIRELEEAAYQTRRQMTEAERDFRIGKAGMEARLDMAEQRRCDELGKLGVLLKKAQECLDSFADASPKQG